MTAPTTPGRETELGVPELPTVDVHSHFLPRGAREAAQLGTTWQGSRIVYPAQPSSGKTEQYDEIQIAAAGYLDEPGVRAGRFRQTGVDKQIVSLSPALYRYDMPTKQAILSAREVNEELAQWQEDMPDCYGGLGTLPLPDVDASVAELERVMVDLRLSGVMVNTHVAGENWDAPQLRPILSAASALGAVLFFHPAQQRIAEIVPRYQLRNLVGNPFETTVAIASLIFGGVLDQIPEAKLLFAHGGGYACAGVGRWDHGYTGRDEARQARRLPSDYLSHLYVDSLTHSEVALREVIACMDVTHVLLGSDFPAQGGLDDPVGAIKSYQSLDALEQHAILRGNAEVLFGS